MTNLTEKWKKGELPYAEYYIKLAGGEYTNDVWDIGGWQSFNKKGDVVDEVLAEVPSFEEWQEYKNANDSMFDTVKMLNKDNYKLEKENTKLKELLKECRSPINYALCLNLGEEEKKEFKNLLLKIKQVLGEE